MSEVVSYKDKPITIWPNDWGAIILMVVAQN